MHLISQLDTLVHNMNLCTSGTEMGRCIKLANTILYSEIGADTMPSIKQTPGGSDAAPSMSPEDMEQLTFSGTRVSKYTGR